MKTYTDYNISKKILYACLLVPRVKDELLHIHHFHHRQRDRQTDRQRERECIRETDLNTSHTSVSRVVQEAYSIIIIWLGMLSEY
jgi:hypothetical protein